MNWGDKMKLRIFRLLFLSLGLALSLLTILSKGTFGDTSIGIYYGYSFIAEEKRYDEDIRGDYGEYFKIMDTTIKYGLYFQYFPKNKRLGFFVEIFIQNNNAVVHDNYVVYHDTINGIEQSWEEFSYRFEQNLMGLVLGLNYRLFEESTRFNPYVTLGLVRLSDFDFIDPSPEPCPSETDVKVGGGIRYRMTNRSFLNLGISYFPANSFSSIRGGLEISL
jgi:hypothetical protein